MINWLSNMWQTICGWTSGVVGSGIASTGIVIQQLALVGIIAGIILWMFRYTKVFRWSTISYLIGIIIEILGLLII